MRGGRVLLGRVHLGRRGERGRRGRVRWRGGRVWLGRAGAEGGVRFDGFASAGVVVESALAGVGSGRAKEGRVRLGRIRLGWARLGRSRLGWVCLGWSRLGR